MIVTNEPMPFRKYVKFGYKCGLEPFTYESHLIACQNGFGYNFYSEFLTAYFMISEDKNLFIAGITVDRDERRKKHLTNFFNYIIGRFEPKIVSLAVGITNEPMLNFVKKVGFVKVDIFKDIKDAEYYEYTCPR